MAELTATLNVSLNATHKGNNAIAAQVHNPSINRLLALTNGTGAKQCDVMYADRLTLASAANQDIDLLSAIANAAGINVAAVEVAMIVVAPAPANTTDITVGGAAANAYVGPFGAATHTIKVRPGGIFVVASDDATGIGAVTAGTADLLRITNGAGASATVDVMIIGRSA